MESRDNKFAKEILQILQDTTYPVNTQNEWGNTIAHLIAETIIENRALLVNIFNLLIKKNIDPFMLNNEGKTPKKIAHDKKIKNRHWCYDSNANLFYRLELGFSENDQFVLHDDEMTISFKKIDSKL